MARPLKIAWKRPAEVFYQLYKQEVDARIAKRWQVLWMLRRGGAMEAGERGSGGSACEYSAVGEVI